MRSILDISEDQQLFKVIWVILQHNSDSSNPQFLKTLCCNLNQKLSPFLCQTVHCYSWFLGLRDFLNQFSFLGIFRIFFVLFEKFGNYTVMLIYALPPTSLPWGKKWWFKCLVQYNKISEGSSLTNWHPIQGSSNNSRLTGFGLKALMLPSLFTFYLINIGFCY